MIIPPLFRNQAFSCAITLSLLAAGSASAVNKTWDGGGGVDISWTTGLNWNADTAPVPSADTLRFQGTSVANSNNFVAGTIFQKIDFRATNIVGNAAFDLVGNSVTLDAGSPITTSVMTNGTLTDKISLDLSLSNNGPTITTGTAHNLNIAGVISGAAGSLTKAGAATLTLSGVNTFSGKTVVSAGTLELTEARALQNSPLDALTSITGDAANGLKITTTTLTLGGLRGSTTNALTPVRALASLFTTTSGGYASLTELTLNNIAATDYTYNQVIANGAAGMSLIKTGAGTQIFDVDAAHTYSGGTTLSAGTLQIGSSSAGTVGAVTSGPLGTGTAVLNGGTLSSSSTNAQTLLNAATIGGNVTLGDAVDNGMLNFSAGVDLGAADRTLTTASSVAFNGAVSGNGGITKAGSATLTLGANNTYLGNTVLSQGSLIINGNQSSATGAFTVASGAMLGGSGTIGGATTISGIHSPGNSAGVQTFASNLTYIGTPTVEWELTANTTTQASPTPVFDQIVVNGNLDFSVATTLTLNFALAGSTVDWSNGLWGSDITGTSGWLVYDVAGSLSDFQNLLISVENWADGQGALLGTVRAGSSFSLYNDGNDIYLTYAIPEPSTYALLSLLGAGIAGRIMVRRRRSHGVD